MSRAHLPRNRGLACNLRYPYLDNSHTAPQMHAGVDGLVLADDYLPSYIYKSSVSLVISVAWAITLHSIEIETRVEGPRTGGVSQQTESVSLVSSYTETGPPPRSLGFSIGWQATLSATRRSQHGGLPESLPITPTAEHPKGRVPDNSR